MQNNSSLSKVLILVVILIIIAVIYLLGFGKDKTEVVEENNDPLQVLTPEGYPEGTTLSLYKNAPPEFPADVLVEEEELTYSSTLAFPGGEEDSSVAYVSGKSHTELVEMYQKNLTDMGWVVSVEPFRFENSVITATKENEILIISISQNAELKSELTFQYENS